MKQILVYAVDMEHVLILIHALVHRATMVLNVTTLIAKDLFIPILPHVQDMEHVPILKSVTAQEVTLEWIVLCINVLD